jgi:hypothetical protein
MDDDRVLRSLGADLERDDPALAALLSGNPAHHHSRAWSLLLVLLLIPALLLPALLLPARITVGVLALLLILSSPVLVAWLLAESPRPPDAPG